MYEFVMAHPLLTFFLVLGALEAVVTIIRGYDPHKEDDDNG